MKLRTKRTRRRWSHRRIVATAAGLVAILLLLEARQRLAYGVIRRLGKNLVVLSVVGAVVLSACAEAKQGERASNRPTVSVPGREPVELPSSRLLKDLVVIGFDTSVSNVAERDVLIEQLIKAVIPEAARRKAFVEVTPVGDRAYNGSSNVIQLDFRPASDNPVVNGETTGSAATKLVAALDKQLARPPAQASDPLGFLRRVGDRVEQYPKARVLAVYLGDGASSTAACDLGLLPVDLASAASTASNCVTATGGPFTLRSAKDPGELWLIGLGLDLDGGLDTSRALGIRRVLTAIVDQAGGHVTRAGIDAIGGAR